MSKGRGAFAAAAGEETVDEDAEEDGEGDDGGGIEVEEVKDECSWAE
jgi:hypothetical protein